MDARADDLPGRSKYLALRQALAAARVISLSIVAVLGIGGAEASCIHCHIGIEAIAVGEMAEEIHAIGRRHEDPSGCVVCHGGDPLADDKESAHRGAPSRLTATGGPGSFYRDPGDIQVADRTCGQCHEEYVERVRKSVMSTQAETIGRESCVEARQGQPSPSTPPKVFGRFDILDEDGPEPVAGSPAYKSLMRLLRARRPEHFPERLFALPGVARARTGKGGAAPAVNCLSEAALERSGTGCSDCHVPRGTYQGRDPTIDRSKSASLLIHRIQGTGETNLALADGSTKAWTGIPLASCFQCHFDPRLTSVNEIGDAFVHYGDRHNGTGRGLLCQDCHTSIEMHGDGNIAAVNEAQTEVRCEDCHGTIEKLPWELPLSYSGPEAEILGSGAPRGTVVGRNLEANQRASATQDYLLTSRGNPFENVVREGDRVLLYSVSGQEYEVTLLKHVVEQGGWRSELSRQVKSAADPHRNMACADCHADWLPPCLGCHAEAPDAPPQRKGVSQSVSPSPPPSPREGVAPALLPSPPPLPKVDRG